MSAPAALLEMPMPGWTGAERADTHRHSKQLAINRVLLERRVAGYSLGDLNDVEAAKSGFGSDVRPPTYGQGVGTRIERPPPGGGQRRIQRFERLVQPFEVPWVRIGHHIEILGCPQVAMCTDGHPTDDDKCHIVLIEANEDRVRSTGARSTFDGAHLPAEGVQPSQALTHRQRPHRLAAQRCRLTEVADVIVGRYPMTRSSHDSNRTAGGSRLDEARRDVALSRLPSIPSPVNPAGSTRRKAVSRMKISTVGQLIPACITKHN